MEGRGGKEVGGNGGEGGNEGKEGKEDKWGDAKG